MPSFSGARAIFFPGTTIVELSNAVCGWGVQPKVAGGEEPDTHTTITKTPSSIFNGLADGAGAGGAGGLNLAVSPGELAVVMGPVGSGKSTLLLSLLGELELRAGILKTRQGCPVLFCPQEPWIFGGTVSLLSKVPLKRMVDTSVNRVAMPMPMNTACHRCVDHANANEHSMFVSAALLKPCQ